MTETRITADMIYTVLLNLLQHHADIEGDGAINWDMTVLDLFDWMEVTPVNFTIESE